MEKNEKKPKGIPEGPPVWVESLMTEKEYMVCAGIYTTYCPDCPRKADFNTSEFRWRYGMGKTLSAQEIKTINDRIDAVLKDAGIVR